MKVIFFSTKTFEREFISKANNGVHAITLLSEPLSLQTVHLAAGNEAVAVFTNDDASAPVIEQLYAAGVKYIVTRAAGYDNISLPKARELGIQVANVPDYSPYAIAEHTIGIILALNRKLILANDQVHQHNYLLDHLIGFDLNGKTAGLIGTGRIGGIVAKILHGFGCQLKGYDIIQDNRLVQDYQLQYTDLVTLCRSSDIITLHTPLNEHTKYLINKSLIREMKPGVMLINTSRGAVVNSVDMLEALKNKSIGFYGMDVYEKEKGLFFYDHSNEQVHDDLLLQFMAMDNVLITPHQAFATREALKNIADGTFYSIDCWEKGETSKYTLTT